MTDIRPRSAVPSHIHPVPRWALWNFVTENWDELRQANTPGEWFGGHAYGDRDRRGADALALAMIVAGIALFWFAIGVAVGLRIGGAW